MDRVGAMSPVAIEAQVWGRVVKFRGERGRSGTAFVLDHDGDQFLVTAKHLTNGERDEIVQLERSPVNSVTRVEDCLTRVGSLEDSFDIAVYRCNEELARRDLVLPIGSDGMVFSQDAFILGFPQGLSLNLTGDSTSLPLAKKGIISGMIVDKGVYLIYLDLIANPGFSGAPVVFHHRETGRLTVAGVVNGTMTQPAAPEEGFESSIIAGISVATDIRHALEAILQ